MTNLRLTPALPPELRPGFLVSGSSPAGRAAARAIDATGVSYPQPPDEERDLDDLADTRFRHGIRVGIIAREDPAEAWRWRGSASRRTARARSPTPSR